MKKDNMLAKQRRRIEVALRNFLNWRRSPIVRDLNKIYSERYKDLEFEEILEDNRLLRYLYGFFATFQIAGSSIALIILLFVFGLFLKNLSVSAINVAKYILFNTDLDSIKILGKSVWDWAELLIVPLLLSVGGFAGTRIFAFREKTERSQDALKNYLDQMSNLLLSEEWPSFERQDDKKIEESKLSTVIRARTIVAVRELDRERIATLLRFLSESRVIQTIVLNDLDLRGICLKDMDCSGINLKGSSLRGAILENINLQNANLSNCDCFGATFKNVKIDGANFDKAFFNFSRLENVSAVKAEFRGVVFEHAKLINIDFTNADLSEFFMPLLYVSEKINFEGAILRNATFETVELENINFSRADLSGASFNEVNLKGANFANANLDQITWKSTNWRRANGLDSAIAKPNNLLSY
jgi:uncharacterized protein YjbI with pentapeptide repeats